MKSAIRRTLAATLVMLAGTPSAFAQSDPFQSNPGPAPPVAAPRSLPRAPPPEPEADTAAPSSAPKYDGLWAGNYTCGPTGSGQAGFVHAMQATVRNNRMELTWGIPATTGSQQFGGVIAANGTVRLVGQGISSLPGPGYNKPYVIELSGRFTQEQFGAKGAHGDRSCELVLRRTPS